MRLVLAWLLGVPLLVGSMVLARAAFAPPPPVHALQAQTHEPARAEISGCLAQRDDDGVAPAVLQERDRIACEALAIQ